MKKKSWRQKVFGAALFVMGAVGLGCISLTGLRLQSWAASPVVAAGQAGQTEGSGGEGLLFSPGQKEEPQMVENGLGIVVEQLDAARDPAVDQLVVVTGTGMDSSQVKVGYYVREKKGEGPETVSSETFWKEEFCTEGCCGHDGMSADKKEGDRRTPLGTYSFTRAFGSLENPGSRLPYKQLDEGDYWVDDGNSRYYNQMVNTSQVQKDWNSAEHLIGVMPQYRYSLALNYNTEERIPGKGSAIFLHGLHTWKTWTEGCIAIPEEYVKLLVQQLGENARIVILPQIPDAQME